MSKECLVEKINISCPFCEKDHMLEKRKRVTQGIVKGEIVDYEEFFYLCPITNEEENEFVPAALMDENPRARSQKIETLTSVIRD